MPSKENRSSVVAGRILPKMGVIWIAPSVFDLSLDWPAARDIMRGINVETALSSMSMLNAVSSEFAKLSEGEERHRAKQIEHLVNFLFAPEDRPRAMTVYAENAANNFSPLAPQAYIAMTESCIRYCDRESGIRFEQPFQFRQFAWVLLSFQASLLPEELAKNLDFERLSPAQFSAFTRNYLSANFDTEFPPLVGRHYMMFCGATKSGVLWEKFQTTATEWFKGASGVDPMVYGFFQIIFFGLGSELSLNAPDLSKLIYDLDRMFSGFAAQIVSAFRRIHDLAVISFEEVYALPEPQNWEQAVYHQHYLRRRPIWHLADGKFLCLYKQLIIEKTFGSTIHTLTEIADRFPPAGWPADDKQRRLKVRNEIGYIFEDYLRTVLPVVFSGPEVTTKFGFNVSGAEQDALVMIGSTALVFEFVHHPWSLKERNSGATEDFVKHLADNVRKARRVALALEAGLEIDGVTFKSEKIVPLILMSDMMPVNAATAPTLEAELVAATDALSVNGERNIRPIQTLSTAQLLNLDRIKEAESGAFAIARFLEKRARDPIDRFSGHSDLDQVLGAPARLGAIVSQAEQLFTKMAENVIPRRNQKDPRGS